MEKKLSDEVITEISSYFPPRPRLVRKGRNTTYPVRRRITNDVNIFVEKPIDQCNDAQLVEESKYGDSQHELLGFLKSDVDDSFEKYSSLKEYKTTHEAKMLHRDLDNNEDFEEFEKIRTLVPVTMEEMMSLLCVDEQTTVKNVNDNTESIIRQCQNVDSTEIQTSKTNGEGLSEKEENSIDSVFSLVDDESVRSQMSETDGDSVFDNISVGSFPSSTGRKSSLELIDKSDNTSVSEGSTIGEEVLLDDFLVEYPCPTGNSEILETHCENDSSPLSFSYSDFSPTPIDDYYEPIEESTAVSNIYEEVSANNVDENGLAVHEIIGLPANIPLCVADDAEECANPDDIVVPIFRDSHTWQLPEVPAIGDLPGIDVGHIFKSREELSKSGLHPTTRSCAYQNPHCVFSVIFREKQVSAYGDNFIISAVNNCNCYGYKWGNHATDCYLWLMKEQIYSSFPVRLIQTFRWAQRRVWTYEGAFSIRAYYELPEEPPHIGIKHVYTFIRYGYKIDQIIMEAMHAAKFGCEKLDDQCSENDSLGAVDHKEYGNKIQNINTKRKNKCGLVAAELQRSLNQTIKNPHLNFSCVSETESTD